MAFPFYANEPGGKRVGLRAEQFQEHGHGGIRRKWLPDSRRRVQAGGGTPTNGSPDRKVLFEPLEPRYLLSADLMPLDVDMAQDGDDLTLRLDQLSQNLQVLDNKNGFAVVKQRRFRRPPKLTSSAPGLPTG